MPAKIVAFATTRWPIIVAIMLGVALIFFFLLAYCQGRSDGSAKADKARAEANVEAMATASAAVEKAADERINDASRDAANKQELENVEATCTGNDDCRIRRGCTILRQQGSNTASVPACRRLGL